MTIDEARRCALAAQGLTGARPNGRIDRRHLRAAVRNMGLIQIDSVNVLVRSQELPLFARLGPHPRDLIPRATAAGELFEYWVHEASHVPTEHHPLHRWKMSQPHRWSGITRVVSRRKGLVEEVFARVRDEGPLVAGDLSRRSGPKGPWWDWDDAKVALEYLFWGGRVTAYRRENDFARVYDLPERVIPASVLALPTPPERDARKRLLELAAGHLGVGTVADLADYHRQKATDCRPLVAELAEEGRLEPVSVDGWRDTAYVVPGVRVPRRVEPRALLSPFDPVVWNRDRAERLFSFRYRIEIYTPAAKRVYGYYVLPFLLGEQLVARLDLKADRASGTLQVLGAFAEEHIRTSAQTTAVVEAVAGELGLMAGWLGLERVDVRRNGVLARHLQRKRISVDA